MRKVMALAALAAGAVCAASPAAAFDFVTVRRTIDVNRSAADVWAKVGGYCTISDWLKLKCVMKSGSGDVGTVRLLNDQVEEVMVGKTATSYTYYQNLGPSAASLYHGTLDVVPTGAKTSRIVYTLVYDQQAMSAADRTAQTTRLNTAFQQAIEAMKKMAEGG
jgi:hypothetical protein